MEIIKSIKDPKVEFARQLSTSKGRMQNQACLLEGIEQVEWGLFNKCDFEHVFICDKFQNNELIKKLGSIKCFIVSEGIIKKITDTNYLVPIVGVISTKNLISKPSNELIIVLDNLQDHGNIGTIIRTAAAFDIHDIVFTNHADPFFKKTIDASRGTIFRTHISYNPSGLETINKLKESGYQIVATSPHAPLIQSLSKLQPKPVALIVGNESIGCSREILDNSDIVVQIPMSEFVESLNVAIASGISIYELRLKVIIAMIQDKIKGTLGRNLSVASQLMRQVFDKELKKVSHISSDQFILLMILACDQKMTFKQITHDLGKVAKELESIINPLQKDGLIKINQEEISMLPAGEELIAKLWQIHQSTENKALGGFSDQEKQLLNNFIKRIQMNCEKLIL